MNILRFYFHIFDLKAFVSLAGCACKAYFPRLPNYENFLKATNRSFPFTALLLRYFLLLNRRMNRDGLFFLDPAALSVCGNGNISTRKVANGFAARGKTSKGWFFGFKLHGACDTRGRLVSLRFTAGNEHDSQEAEPLTGGLTGLFVGDAGYLLKQEAFIRLFEKHRRILAAARRNMKRLMTEDQGRLFRRRSAIETVWGVLKERYGLVFHLARNIIGLFRHYCYSLVSYMLQPVLPSCPLRLPDISLNHLP